MTWLVYALIAMLVIKWSLIATLLVLIKKRGWPPPGMSRSRAAWWGGFLYGATLGAIRVR